MTRKNNPTPNTDGNGVTNANPEQPINAAHSDGNASAPNDAPPSTLRDGQSSPPPPSPQAPAVANLDGYPYPFNQGTWIRCTPDTDPGFVEVIERAHFQGLDRPSVELFTSKIEPSVSGVCYTIRRDTGVEVYMTAVHAEQVGFAFSLAQQARAAKERALQEQQRAGAALLEGPPAPEQPAP